MIGIICMFFPAVILCYLRRKIFEVQFNNKMDNIIHFFYEYVCGNVLINTLIIFVRIIIKKKTENVYIILNEFSNFAIKYLLFALFLAVTIPYAEKYFRKNISVSFRFDMSCKPIPNKIKLNIVACYAVIMILHHFIRIFDNSFGIDEGLVVIMTRKDWGGMLEYVAANGHSPFHYAFAWICVRIFGESGFIYHFSATLPYFILIVLISVVVRKWFGNKAALILITLSTLLECAVTYNLEIRMYAWCQLFIFLAYLMSYKFYRTKENKYYVLISLFSLGAVYSHYFALGSIGLIYLVILLFVLKTNIKDMWKVFISGGLVLGLLIPWLIYAKKIRGVVMSDYHITEVSWYDCIEFIFHSKYSMILITCFFATILIGLIYDLGIISINKFSDGKKRININFVLKEMDLDVEWVWIFSGILAVFGSIAVAELISSLIYPIITLRYLYVSYIIIWLLFAVGISKCKLNKLWTIVLIAFIFVTCYPVYWNTVKAERSNNKRLESTLACTVSDIDEADIIYTDIVHFVWTVGKVYYPNTTNYLFGHPERWGPAELPELTLGTEYWLFLSTPITEKIIENLDNQNYGVEMVMENGYIGTGNVWIYKIKNADTGENKE